MTNTDSDSVIRKNCWQHVVRAGPHPAPLDGEPDPEEHCEQVEPRLSALFQAEHLNVLVGSGFTTAAIARAAGARVVDMSPAAFEGRYADAVMQAAPESTRRLSREEPKIEDHAYTACAIARLDRTRADSRRGSGGPGETSTAFSESSLLGRLDR